MDTLTQNTLLAGHLVQFVILDKNGNPKNDKKFTARCHFLPQKGDTIMIGQAKKTFVKDVYHTLLNDDNFEQDIFLQFVTVVLTDDDQSLTA